MATATRTAAKKAKLTQTAAQNVNISFKLSLTPAAEFDSKSLSEGMAPVFDAKGRKLAKVVVGGQAFNLLLSKTTTWEPAAAAKQK
jgi:hypothetical protein